MSKIKKESPPSLAEILNDWLLRTFTRRRLCYVFFYYTESSVSLKKPVEKVQPYLAYINPKAGIKQASELFMVVTKKDRNVKLTKFEIKALGRVPVI